MIPFDTTLDYILENDRVLLRPLTADDHEHLLHFALNEPDIWKFSLVPVAGDESLRNYIDTTLKARAAGSEYAFIVFDKFTGRHAGCTRFYDIQPAHEMMQLGYTWYGKDFWGSGLNRNCKFLLLQFAFETLGMERVEFRADHNNARSIAAMKAIGCTPEGILRNHLITHTGTRRSSIVLSILKEEWLNGVREKLKELIC